MERPRVYRYGTQSRWRWHWINLLMNPGIVILILLASGEVGPFGILLIVPSTMVFFLIPERLRLERERVELYNDRVEVYDRKGKRTVLRNEEIEGLSERHGFSTLHSHQGDVPIPASLSDSDELVLRLQDLATHRAPART